MKKNTQFVTESMMSQFVAAEPSETISERLSDLAIDSGLNGKKGYVILSVKGFKLIARRNLIDYIPDGNGRCNVPTVFGFKIIIPGHNEHSAGFEYAAVCPAE
jgi:hypothetical protein